jgi:hypothetical protein
VILVCRLWPLWRRFAQFYYHCIGTFNVDLLDPGHSLFPRFLDFLEKFMLCNVTTFPTRRASSKLVDLFLVSNPNDVMQRSQLVLRECGTVNQRDECCL